MAVMETTVTAPAGEMMKKKKKKRNGVDLISPEVCVVGFCLYFFWSHSLIYISIYNHQNARDPNNYVSIQKLNKKKKEKRKKEVKSWKKIRKIEIQRVQIFSATIVHSCRTCKCGLTPKNLMHSFFFLLFCVFFERCAPICLISPRYGVLSIHRNRIPPSN